MLLKIILIPIIIYLALLILVLLVSNKIIFIPPASSYTDNDKIIIKLKLSSGIHISAIYLHNPKAKYTLLYSHGNAEDLGKIEECLLNYYAEGFSVFAYDYPGYGTSEGSANEKNVYESIFAAYTYLTESLHIPASQIIAYGFSIGSGPSVELATQKPLAALILQSPILSAVRVVTFIEIFPWDKFDNLKKIRHIKAPLLIYHGRADDIVPFYNGKTLFKEAHEPKSHLWVDKADHNNFIYLTGQPYWDTLRKFVDNL